MGGQQQTGGASLVATASSTAAATVTVTEAQASLLGGGSLASMGVQAVPQQALGQSLPTSTALSSQLLPLAPMAMPMEKNEPALVQPVVSWAVTCFPLSSL